MLVMIDENIFVETRNICSIYIDKQKYPDTPESPNPHKEESTGKEIFDYGYCINFTLNDETTWKSEIYKTKNEATLALTNWMKKYGNK